MAQTKTTRRKKKITGKLRIGDDWNAITIIALSQTNPLKAVAEFVENCIDAQAHNVTIVRGREGGQPYLRITDDGDGILRDDQGVPDFKFVATHICDSIKKRLKAEGVEGIQGEFGIGLMSFWIMGEELTISSAGIDGKTYEMHMAKGDPSYRVLKRRTLFPERGTELKIKPLLPGIRQLSGEKIQWFLASELRDRIRNSGVQIWVIDRQARKEYKVEPRQFTGRLLHQLPDAKCDHGDVYLELYIAEPETDNHVGLYRSGTRILENVLAFEAFQHTPWNEGYLQGIVDAPFLHLTPGTRSAIIHDDTFVDLCRSLEPVEESLSRIIAAQKRAEEEQASKRILRSVQRALREALLNLPAEEYDWFDIHADTKGGKDSKKRQKPSASAVLIGKEETSGSEQAADEPQKKFFDYAGPLHSVRISPASCVVPVGKSKNLRALPRDRSRRLVEKDLTFLWHILEGGGHIENNKGEIASFVAGSDPELCRVGVTVHQRDIECTAEAIITVTDTLISEPKQQTSPRQGLPGYTFKYEPGKLWRSQYSEEKNIIVINSGHRDFVFSSRKKALKLRYICRLFAKELVFKNFHGYPPDQLLERMIELSLYTEENLK